MILQALVQYHGRLVEEGRTAPPGYVQQEIPFLIILSDRGEFRGLQDTRSGDGRIKRARSFMVPKGVKPTGQIAPNTLWDNPAYLFARPKLDGRKDPEKEIAKACKAHAACLAQHKGLFPVESRPFGVGAVLSFLERSDFEQLFHAPEWPEIEEKGLFLTFALEGQTALVCDAPEVREAVARAGSAVNEEFALGTCLVSGRREPIARLHTGIKGVRGTQPSGGNILSFKLDAFRSHGWLQGMNAPVGAAAEAAYTSALNTLLAKDSSQKMVVSGTTTVFWAERQTPMEDLLVDLFGLAPEVTDSPRDLDSIRTLLTAPKTGAPPPVDDPTRFYILGLAPNAARIAVRFWHVGTVGEMARHLLRYFEEILIIHRPEEADCPTLDALLRATAVQGKRDNVAPNLAGEVVTAILTGRPFPRTLLNAVIQRIRSDQNVFHARAALIKAILIRQARHSQPQRKEVDVSLDVTNPNPGYRLGRLFAVLERAQERANPGLNKTIRERYYGSASSTPVLSFPILMKLHTHHLAKLEYPGEAVNLGKLVGEIMDGLSTFPPHLTLDDQGRFAIGYYHQRQAFFQKSTDTPNGGEK